MHASPPPVLVTWTGKDNTSDADGQFNKAPYFNFNDGKLKFDTNDVDNANENYGSASGLLPKFLPSYATGILTDACLCVAHWIESTRRACGRFRRSFLAGRHTFLYRVSLCLS